MKKTAWLLSLLLIIMVVILPCDFQKESFNNEKVLAVSGGIGTEQDPYIMETFDDFLGFAEYINNGDGGEGEYFELGADIELGCIFETGFLGVGSVATPFKGYFDGKGYAFKNITSPSGVFAINVAEAVGIFGFVQDAIIKNLKIMNVDLPLMGFDVSINSGAFGLIAGYAINSLFFGCWLDNINLGIIGSDGKAFGLMVGGLEISAMAMCMATNVSVEIAFAGNEKNFSYFAGETGYTGNSYMWDDFQSCYVQVLNVSQVIDDIGYFFDSYSYNECLVVSDSQHANYTKEAFIAEGASVFVNQYLYLDNTDIGYFSASYIMDGLPMLSSFFWEGEATL